MTSLWAISDIITAAKLNKAFNSGLDNNKGTPSVVGEAYLATDTDITYYSTNGTSWDKRFLNAQDKNYLIQMIQQVHPTLQVLAAMDETTYLNIEKSGNNYILSTSSLQDLTTYTKTDPTSNLAVTATRATLTGGGVTPRLVKNIGSNTDFSINFEYYVTTPGSPYGKDFAVIMGDQDADVAAGTYNGIGLFRNTLSLYASKWVAGARTDSASAVTISAATLYYCTIARSGTTLTLSVYTNSARTTHATGSPISLTVVNTAFSFLNVINGHGDSYAKEVYVQNVVAAIAATTGNILSASIASDSAVLSFFKHLNTKISNGGSTHATPVQAEIYGNADGYAAALHTTKFTVNPAAPRILLKRNALDTITASSAGQTVWNMTVAGGMPALTGSNHGTILATEIGVASILAVEKSILGDFTDAVVLAEGTDYVVDYSTRTATKITLTSGTGIVNAQSKIRLTWIADVMKIDGATNNTALKCKLYLNRTAGGETSPSIQPVDLGSGKYVEMLYGT